MTAMVMVSRSGLGLRHVAAGIGLSERWSFTLRGRRLPEAWMARRTKRGGQRYGRKRV
jgi:hypothetical protein